MSAHMFLLFLTTVLALIITPGPDMIYVAGRSLSQGKKAAIFSALGVAIGYVGHTLLVTLGLASVLAASPFAFRIIQVSGAFYLIYLAISMLRSHASFFHTDAHKEISTLLLVRQGVLTSLLNPKGLLFYFAILPQFCVEGSLPVSMQMLIYGLVTSLLCFAMYTIVGLTASRAGSTFRENGKMKRILPKLSGGILLSLGLYLLFPLQK